MSQRFLLLYRVHVFRSSVTGIAPLFFVFFFLSHSVAVAAVSAGAMLCSV